MALASIDATHTIEELRAEISDIPATAENAPAPEFALMLDAFQALYIELLLDQPRVDNIQALYDEAQQYLRIINLRAIEEIRQRHATTVFGGPGNVAKVTQVFKDVSKKIAEAAGRNATRLRSISQDDPQVIDTPGATVENAGMSIPTREEVDAKLAQNKAEVDARLASFDTSIKTGFAELRAEFAEMRAEMAKQTGEMRAEMANVRADSHKATTEVTRWVVGFGIAILGAIFGFAKISDKPATAATAQPVAQQQPIVVAVPDGSTVLTAPKPPAETAPPPAK